MKTWPFYLLAVVVLLLDQATKLLAEHSLLLHETVPVVPFFNITLAYNTGAAFSFLADQGGWQRWFFSLLALLVSIALVVWISRLKRHEKGVGYALSLILGGAVGNLIDRVLYGHVIDFLDVYYGSYHWPAFNIADSAICVGAVLMVWYSFHEPKAD